MAGRIREDDIALVRDRVRIDEVVSQYVTLRGAGGGSLKGLCPFHDEKTPSFNVTPARNVWYCFGCGAGGDAIAFVQQVEGLSFGEAVERLADRYGVQLRYSEGGEAPRGGGNLRARLVEANRRAAEFYAEQLESSAEAAAGRRFLEERGFDVQTARRFGVGFAPRGGEALLSHLRRLGFRDDELVTAGLVARGARGAYDRFRGRLLWPIKDLSADVVGFGARRLFDDDRVEAKYLNTPETPIYKKSQVLYGVDLARREIARSSQAVVVEGYTDVMACHEAGVRTAVATCGTAFGEDHGRVLRRLLLDHDEFRGEVIFTFDGDEAGQRAALRAFQGDQQFVAQTYVAVEPDGLDPCDLRLAQGDAAVRELVARRVPLYRFVLRNVVGRYDLDRADGRVDAMRAAAELVSSVRDKSKVDAFAREVAGMVGVDVDEVRAEVRRAADRGRRRSRAASGDAAAGTASSSVAELPDPQDPRYALERETLKLFVQHPALVTDAVGDLGHDDFTHPTYAVVWDVLAKHREQAASVQPAAWTTLLRESAGDENARRLLVALAVEPLPVSGDPDTRYAKAHVARLRELTTARRIATVKAKLQRTNPVDEVADYNRMFGELVALEQHRRTLREEALGGL